MLIKRQLHLLLITQQSLLNADSTTMHLMLINCGRSILPTLTSCHHYIAVLLSRIAGSYHVLFSAAAQRAIHVWAGPSNRRFSAC
jgi:hypothetical protein